ncbi:reprolysin-like metallopeptidase [Flavobacterium aquicola]|uniref:Putative secreted protein (Por secretion system target) n=1 Tax=Flavobacterium aquicola TaxID=1682742 RepID=A0A3E0DYN1_9FLAO|nr:zinc-dependent metalloprotease family protein [Flavobacterium aquicola]REG91204.1 putative secreted protein (Por secretion system target) [Flavobacterium aquicola]
MNKLFLFIGVFTVSFAGFSQVKSAWKAVGNSQKIASQKGDAENVHLYTLDVVEFKKSLETFDLRNSNSKGVSVSIPNGEGKMEQFLVVESSNFVPELQAQYPNIHSYSGTGITDAKASISFSISPNGVQTMVLRGDKASEFIDPLPGNRSIYAVSSSNTRTKGALPLFCKTVDINVNKGLTKKASQLKSSAGVFKTLRLALSCTGEYAQYFGGSKAEALAAMNATMTRVNGIFNKDLAIKLVLIANESAIIYTDPDTDPYSESAAGVGDGEWSSELQTTLTTVIGNANYDIGHLFGDTGGGGAAGCIGCVCVNPTVSVPDGKGSGFTSPSNGVPEGDKFDIDFVAHEMGHQLGANHTFSHDVEGTGVSVEPGSGSTIMGYAGITDYDVQNQSDDYFSYASIKQIQDNLANKICPVSTVLNDQTPNVEAGLDYTIPKGTPFVLKGKATDANGDAMTYCWEQNDSAAGNESEDNSYAYGTKVYGPNFRSFSPSTVTYRYFPDFNKVLIGQLNTTWESVSTIGRKLNFVFTARDNAASGLGQTHSDAMAVTVDGNKGPFAVTSQYDSNSGWILGSSQTITWSVNGSNLLSGAANVNIKLSTDGGLTFPISLAANTPNDGSEIVMAPSTAAKNCRILIEPVENIFYAVNSTPFSLGYGTEASCDTYTFSAPYNIPESQTYAERTITVPATVSEITDVNFNISFTHAYMSDVQIEVVSPSGTTVKLFDSSCKDENSSLVLKYDDLGGNLSCGTISSQTVVPVSSLSALNGESPQGIWKLRFRDAIVGDTGKITAASIQICSSVYTSLGVSQYEIKDFLVYPNPNKGNFTVSFKSNDSDDIRIFVNDMDGKKVYDKKFKNTGDVNEIVALANTAAGTYIVTVEDGGRKGVSKIIVN